MTSTPHLSHEKLLDILLDVVCVVDKEGRFLSVSPSSERVFGFRPDEMIGRTAFEMMHPDDRSATREVVARINSGEPSDDHENRYFHKDGHVVHIMWSTQWLEAEQVRVGVARDITARKRIEARQTALYSIAQAAHLTEDLQTLYAAVHMAIRDLLPLEDFAVALRDVVTDQLSFPYYANHLDLALASPPQAYAIFCADVLRSDKTILLTPQTTAPAYEKLGIKACKLSTHWLGIPLISGTGTLGALVLRSDPDSDGYSEKDKEMLQFAATQVATAIERKRVHARLEFLARYDQLTELPNRALFLDRLHSALQRARRNSSKLAILYLDMDNFKQINDTFGHAAGDHLLREVAARLNQCVRESDTVSRIGGDEFVMLLEAINTREDAVLVAEKTLISLRDLYILDGLQFTSSPSIGIAVYPEHALDDLHLVQLADQAMYAAKRNGGDSYAIAKST